MTPWEGIEHGLINPIFGARSAWLEVPPVAPGEAFF
jgi:hypothetical protein